MLAIPGMAGRNTAQGQAQRSLSFCALQASGANSNASTASGICWAMPIQPLKGVVAQEHWQSIGVDAALIALVHGHAIDSEVQRESGTDPTLAGMLSRQLSSVSGVSGGHLDLKCCDALQAYIPPAALHAHTDECAAGSACLTRKHAGLAEACWHLLMPARQPQR